VTKRSNKPSEVSKSRQKRLLIAILGGFSLLALAIYVVLPRSQSAVRFTGHQHVDLPSKDIKPREVRLARVEDQNKLFETRMQYLEGLITKYGSETEKRTKQAIEEATKAAAKTASIQARHEADQVQSREIEDLRAEIRAMKEQISSPKETSTQQSFDDSLSPIGAPLNHTGDLFKPVAEKNTKSSSVAESIARKTGKTNDPAQKPTNRPLRRINLWTDDRKRGKPLANVKKTIPAGTTVKALLVSSLDAPCGVSVSSDPRPVKLRILDDGHLPKEVTAKLKGGIIIASAYGDLSSERTYVRLERMTQVRPDGDFVETEVTGYVTGEDGKYGIRGVVVDRSARLIASAAFTGFLGGINQYLQATINAQNIAQATQGLPNNDVINLNVLKSSGLQGLTNGLDQLSEYFIKRAEQLQPVIQVAAGRIVDITFTHSAGLGDLHTKALVRREREKSRVTDPSDVEAAAKRIANRLADAHSSNQNLEGATQ